MNAVNMTKMKIIRNSPEKILSERRVLEFIFLSQELDEVFQKYLQDGQHIKDNIPPHMPRKKGPLK